MNIKAEFADGTCRLVLTCVDLWEQTLMGAVAKGGYHLTGTVRYEATPPFYPQGTCKAVHILLEAAGDTTGEVRT